MCVYMCVSMASTQQKLHAIFQRRTRSKEDMARASSKGETMPLSLAWKMTREANKIDEWMSQKESGQN